MKHLFGFLLVLGLLAPSAPAARPGPDRHAAEPQGAPAAEDQEPSEPSEPSEPGTADATPDTLGSAPDTREEAIARDVEVLRAQLRPLTKAQVEGLVQPWLDLLHATCLEIRDIEVKGLESASGDDTVQLQQEAVLLRQQRTKLIDRIDAVLKALEEKGGDAAEPRAYLDSVVAAPPITGLKAAVATAVAWLRSRDGGIAVALQTVTALGILLVALLVSRVLGGIASRAMKKLHRSSELLQGFVVASIRRGTLVIGALVALSTLGVNMGPLLAAIGAAGLVIGLALQGTLGNLASGLMIMVFRPFDVGDAVETAGASGKVLGMSLMTTTIRTFDNRTIYVPNSMIWGDIITNVTANDTRRVDMTFGIGYDDDIEAARGVLEGILAAHEKVLKEPAPVVRLHALADSSMNFIVRPWSKTSDYWDVYWDVTAAVKAEFDAHGISIPYPQRDVHLIQPAQGAPTPTA